VWLKAKPEWAKGAKLVRITPRLNREINGYWMCDIGRFDYHWVEGDNRLKRPLVRPAGSLQPASWLDAVKLVRERFERAGVPEAGALHFLISAHASHEEMFLVQQLARGLGAGVSVSWRVREKTQPPGTKFPVPPTDAPNVTGARDLGLQAGTPDSLHPDLADLRAAVEGGRVRALYVFDPGPDGSIGDLSWVTEARASGSLPLLVVQGVLMTALAREADIVLPGASAFEKDASYTNEKGVIQGVSRAMAPPEEAMEDWQILVNIGIGLGAPFTYASSAQVRADLAAAFGGEPRYGRLNDLAFTRPVSARTWLQTSNPSERWKWDFMYQDLPPVKFARPAEEPQRPDIIALRKIE
jgi:predicted molibdopterin-dependent oxidoreductase YjgC